MYEILGGPGQEASLAGSGSWFFPLPGKHAAVQYVDFTHSFP